VFLCVLVLFLRGLTVVLRGLSGLRGILQVSLTCFMGFHGVSMVENSTSSVVVHTPVTKVVAANSS
jgi:hypothetical protein